MSARRPGKQLGLGSPRHICTGSAPAGTSREGGRYDPRCAHPCARRRPSATRAMCAWLSHGSSIARAACSNPITNALSAEVVVDYWTRTTSKRQVSISAILPGACLLPARTHARPHARSARPPLPQSTRSAPVGADRGFTRPLRPSSQRNATQRNATQRNATQRMRVRRPKLFLRRGSLGRRPST
jgi:hypothetical protein